MKNKVILVDCDGVLLDWGYAFIQWMERHGYKLKSNKTYDIKESFGLEHDEGERLVRMFNESAVMRKLPPLRDAVHYVRKLHEMHGFVFRAITSMSTDTYAQHLRVKNLNDLFGDTAFESFTFLDTGADKDEALEAYRDSECFWVEDKIQNAELGADLGLRSLMMRHHYNENHEYKGVRLVNNWAQIYDVITSETTHW